MGNGGTSEQELIELANQVRHQAYAPYSDFAVGAALLTKQGALFTGCNVENGVLGLSICAERVAMSQAVSKGHREFEKIVVAASPLASPCGSCRQFMIEFGTEIEVISVDANNLGNISRWTTGQLLPDHFELRKN